MNVRYWTRHPLRFLRRVWYFFYERAHPTEPFVAPGAIRFLDTALPRQGIGLEWGSGRSTQWFDQRLGRLVVVEHDGAWYEQVRRQLREAGIGNVDYRLIPLDHPPQEPTRPVYDRIPRRVLRFRRGRRPLPAGLCPRGARQGEARRSPAGGRYELAAARRVGGTCRVEDRPSERQDQHRDFGLAASESVKSDTPKAHFKGLNSLRFFAALFVVIGHIPLNQASLGLPHPSYGALFF